MFETAEVGRKLAKAEYEALVPGLRTELLEVQRRLSAASFPVLVLVNGAEGAGKSDLLHVLTEWLDVRDVHVHAMGDHTEEERHRPRFWRFWMALPPRGRIGIFLGSWYTAPILSRIAGRADEAEYAGELARINDFERALAEDGALVVKMWLHVSKKWQKKRFKQLEKDPDTSWRVTAEDWRMHERYDDFKALCEETLRETSTGIAPWTVIEAEDRRYRDIAAARLLLDSVRARLDRPPPSPPPATRRDSQRPQTILDRLDLGRKVAKDEYKAAIERAQTRLHHLARKAFKKEIGSIVVFEGWDAAGKGGAIRRIMQALDARSTKVIRIAAPTDEERAHHYLWRFWRHLPRKGRMTIYDRSWYGRVLVERVERFATEEEWGRAYREINDFEDQLGEHGIVVVKFWLHISEEEQLRRFEERETTPWKRHKIGPEDYRNREKAPEYKVAIDDMIGRTSTALAPWTLVEAEDKSRARIKVVETLANALDKALS